jgi:hypothetical protein
MSKQQTKPHTPTDPADAVAAAEATLTNLKTERQALTGKVKEYEQTASKLAFKARAQNDADASKELQAARDEVVTVSHQMREYDHAIAEAERQLQAVQRIVTLHAEREKALRLKTAAAEYRELIPYWQELATDFLKGCEALFVGADEMRKHGADSPSSSQVLMLHRGIIGILMQTRFRHEFPVLPPDQRKPVEFYVDLWASRAEEIADRTLAAIDAELGEQTEKAA